MCIIRKLLNYFGYDINYVCNWGTYNVRYDSIDFHSQRPVHRKMKVAPPWAHMVIVKMFMKA